MRRYDWPNITILTCLLILGLHEFGTCHGGRSWALGGQAIRMAFALQLHKDLEHDPMRGSGKSQFSFIDREIRRRTMWACFLMDRFNSSGTDRPYFIREETLKIPLPIKEKNFQYDMPGPTETLNGQVLEPLSEDNPNEARENMGVAAWMIKAIALWGRIIAYLNQGGKELDPHPMWSPESEYAKLLKQTEEFQNELPDCLKYTPENLKMHESENMANQFLFLHISIQQNILFMNRFAVSSPGGHSLQDVPKTFVTKAGAKAFAAANRISELLKDAESHFITAPFTGYCAFLSSTVHIFGIFSGNPSMEATSKRNLATNVRFLSKMKRYWGMFHWMSENLREQYRTCADAARQGNKASENASSSPIFQYGDWFDRYPHGVSQSDFLDPAAYKKKEKGDDAVLEQKPELHTVEEFFTNLSPKTAEAAVANGIRPGQPPNASQLNKRKQSITRKPSIASSRGPDQPVGVDPLQADFSRHHSLATAEQLHAAAAAARLHQRSYSVSAASAAGGPPPLQTTGPPGPGFSPLAVGPANPASYPTSALSPVSPVAFSHPHPPAAAAPPFHHPHHHHHHHHHPAPAAFFPNDPFAIPLAATPPHGMTRLDRQLVFGAYGAAHHHHGSAADPAGLRWDGETGPNGASAGAAGGAAGAANGSRDTRHAHHHSLHGGHDPAAAALHAANLFPAAEPSSAWFMPFNMEPPEIGPDGGLGVGAGAGLDAFGGVFGAGAIH